MVYVGHGSGGVNSGLGRTVEERWAKGVRLEGGNLKSGKGTWEFVS
jgi:hypothetical protein